MGDSPSARSALVLVLAEYVAPSGGTVRTSTLLTGLGRLGISESAARQGIRRLAADGWLERAPTRGVWRLGPVAEQVLAEGRGRFARSKRRPPAWDGQWLLVRTRVPESQRDLRHQMRTALAFQGLGSLGQGWWVSADVDVEAAVLAVLDRLGVGFVSTFRASSGAVGADPEQLVREAWDLAEAYRRYDVLLKAFVGADPANDDEVFVAYTRLVDLFRRALAADPQLPIELLPSDWPGEEARALLDHGYERWHAVATAWWARQ